jgi:hypothetical protein
MSCDASSPTSPPEKPLRRQQAVLFRRACCIAGIYGELARVFERGGWKVATCAELAGAMAKALAHLSSPSIIQAVVPGASIPENALWKAVHDEAGGQEANEHVRA